MDQSSSSVSVVGLGYIGLPTAAMFASRRTPVVGVDVNQRVVDTINRGEIHIVEKRIFGGLAFGMIEIIESRAAIAGAAESLAFVLAAADSGDFQVRLAEQRLVFAHVDLQRVGNFPAACKILRQPGVPEQSLYLPGLAVLQLLGKALGQRRKHREAAETRIEDANHARH